MDILKQIWAVLFPYRAHLEDEVVYLRSQLAQKDRRLVEMQDTLAVMATGSSKTPREPREPKPPVHGQPIGWDAKREQLRRDREKNGPSEAEPKDGASATHSTGR